jgi:hypothetical protein
MRRHLVTTAIVVVGLVLATATAYAAKGGNGNGNGGKGSSGVSSATLTASPSPAASGDTVVLSGCGYEFEPVELDITNDATGATEIYWAGMFYAGGADCFSTAFTAGPAGSYTIKAVQQSSQNGTVMASATLEVT